MDITVDVFADTISLDQTEDLKTLQIATGSLIETEVAAVMGPAGYPAGHEQMWVSIEWMRNTALGQGCDASWAQHFDDMVDYAAANGWLNGDSTRIQVHLKRTLLPSTAVVVEAPGDRDDLWAAMIDLDAQSASSDEFQGGEWLVGAPGEVGSQFLGNQKMGHRVWQTTAEIELSQKNLLVQLFVQGGTDGPTSRWRFALSGAEEDQVLRYSCQMGPGHSPLTEYMLQHPEKAERILERRLSAHRSNMTNTASDVAATG